MVVTNGAYYVPAPADYDTATGRVHVHGALTQGAVGNSIVVTYGNNSYTGNGISDAWALQYGFNPLDASVAGADPDGDGFTNLQEFLTGTDPTSNSSYLHITSVKPQGSDVVVTWVAGGGTTNVLQYSTGAPNGNYTTNYVDIAPQIVLPLSGTSIITNQIDAGGATNFPARYYRVRLQP
jgi:hypothetical protein